MTMMLSRDRIQTFRTWAGKENTLTESMAKTAEFIADGKGWIEAFREATPFIKDIADAAEELKIVAVGAKLLKRWVGITDPYQLGALACTLAYQRSAHNALEKLDGKFLKQSARDSMKAAARQIRGMEPAEAMSLETFDFEYALHHPFVLRSHAIFRALLAGTMLSDEQKVEILTGTQSGFLSELRLILNHERTAKQFEPFKGICDKGAEQKRTHWALLQHVNYQYALFAERALLNREPFALKDIYAETECVKREWRDLERGESPYSLQAKDRCDLLGTVNEFLFDKDFNDVIVLQGAAGAGKSSFTLRLCADLRTRGLIPLRIRMKRFRLGDNIFASLSRALELEDENRLKELKLNLPDKETLLNAKLLRTPWVNDDEFSQFVLILDGWDELQLTDNAAFREQVSKVIESLRDKLLDSQDRPLLRVVEPAGLCLSATNGLNSNRQRQC